LHQPGVKDEKFDTQHLDARRSRLRESQGPPILSRGNNLDVEGLNEGDDRGEIIVIGADYLTST